MSTIHTIAILSYGQPFDCEFKEMRDDRLGAKNTKDFDSSFPKKCRLALCEYYCALRGKYFPQSVSPSTKIIRPMWILPFSPVL